MNITKTYSTIFTAFATLMSLLSFTAMQADHHNEKNALSFKMKSIEDKEVNLKEWKGKVLLMVNVASKCGYTPQYEGLQKLHNELKDEGFAVVGFPCNNFGSQSGKRGGVSGISAWLPLHRNIDFHKLVAFVIGVW